MLSEFQKRKLTRLFNLYDVDNDGHLSKADFILVVNNLAAIYHFAEGSHEYTTIYSSYMSEWEQLLRFTDDNRDGYITLDEYLSRYTILLSDPEGFASVAISTVENIIDLIDADQDGRISQQEFSAYLVAHNVAEEDAEIAFKKLDRSGDGYITREEWLNNVEAFFLSNAPDIPGNWLMGPIDLP